MVRINIAGLQSAIQSHWVDVLINQSKTHVKNQSICVSPFNLSVIEYTAIDIMWELDDWNLASMIKHSINDHITAQYNTRVIDWPFRFSVSEKGFEVKEDMDESK